MVNTSLTLPPLSRAVRCGRCHPLKRERSHPLRGGGAAPDVAAGDLRLDALDRDEGIGKRQAQRPLGVTVGLGEVQASKGFDQTASF